MHWLTDHHPQNHSTDSYHIAQRLKRPHVEMLIIIVNEE